MKTTKPLFRFLLPAFLCLMLIGTEALSQQTAGQRYEKALYLEEVNGKLQQAIDQYNLIIKEFPTNREIVAKSMLHIGICSEKLGLNQASENYRAVISKFPEQQSVVSIANQRLSRLDNFTSEATAKAEQTFKLATELFKQGKFEAAITEYEKVIPMSPKSRLAEEAHLWIGQCYFKQGKFDLALSSFKTLTKEFPESTIVPVTEVMISQVQQAMVKTPAKKSIVTLDNKTILDPATGIKYTKINAWKGKYDIITNYGSFITDISPNRKFLLYENKIIPFDNIDPITLYDGPVSRSNYARFSPDGTQIAFKTNKTISVIPISPETGRPTGPIKQVFETEYNLGHEINWSSDGNFLTYYLLGKSPLEGIWTLSIKDHTTKQVTGSITGGGYSNPVFSGDGSNILYRRTVSSSNTEYRIASCKVRKSANILQPTSYIGTYLLSPDNQWVLGTTNTGQLLYRLADKQMKEFATPQEVGEKVSWSDGSDKVLFYCPSFESQNILKVTPVTGGSTFDLGKEFGQFPAGWSPDGTSLIAHQREANKWGFFVINLTDLGLREIEGIPAHGYARFSNDFSQLLILGFVPGNVISTMPVSIKEGKVTGEPIPVFKGFSGVGGDVDWSPDGKKIAICNKGEVYICDTKGGEPVQLTKTPDFENYPLWSPDGKTILVYISSNNQVQIISAIDGHIIKTFEKVDNFAWSPGGQELAIAFLDGQLSIVSMDSGKIRKIADWKEISHFDGLNDLAWSPDGNWIAMNGYNEETAWITRMYVVNSTDGKATELDSGDTRNKDGLMWSPDSKWIFYHTYGPLKTRLEGTLWEADLSDFMNKMEPGSEKGITTDFDFKTPDIPIGGVPADGSFTDARDGHVYKYKRIGEQTWMAENLAWLPAVSPASAYSATEKHYYVYDYNGSDPKEAVKSDNYRKYGVLYNWQAAGNGQTGITSQTSGIKGICPVGWHLPSDTEWMNLERTLGMNDSDLTKTYPAQRSSGFVDKKLRSITGWGDEYHIFLGQSGFNALPGGSMNHKWNFKAIDYISYFWTSTALDEKMIIRCIMLIQQTDSRAPGSKDAAFSVRCIKDK